MRFAIVLLSVLVLPQWAGGHELIDALARKTFKPVGSKIWTTWSLSAPHIPGSDPKEPAFFLYKETGDGVDVGTGYLKIFDLGLNALSTPRLSLERLIRPSCFKDNFYPIGRDSTKEIRQWLSDNGIKPKTPENEDFKKDPLARIFNEKKGVRIWDFPSLDSVVGSNNDQVVKESGILFLLSHPFRFFSADYYLQLVIPSKECLNGIHLNDNYSEPFLAKGTKIPLGSLGEVLFQGVLNETGISLPDGVPLTWRPGTIRKETALVELPKSCFIVLRSVTIPLPWHLPGDSVAAALPGFIETIAVKKEGPTGLELEYRLDRKLPGIYLYDAKKNIKIHHILTEEPSGDPSGVCNILSDGDNLFSKSSTLPDKQAEDLRDVLERRTLEALQAYLLHVRSPAIKVQP